MLSERLTEAREIAGYTQAEAASSLGVSRAMISYWEAGTRQPNDRQLVGLARLYDVDVAKLRAAQPLHDVHVAAQMMFRGAEQELPPAAKRGLREFEGFLDLFARLAEALKVDLHGLKQSPFPIRGGFDAAEDARRKAEEVRAFLRVGLGPVDVERACEMLGVTVFKAPLGPDLRTTISGAYFNHPRIGFSVLVNLEMTPGRRRFTAAHELGHALFHSGEKWVLSFADKSAKERFADAFAGEFLMPAEGIRRIMEEHGFGPRVSEPADVIHLQRHYGVSYLTALVRLRQANLLSSVDYHALKSVRPVLYARALGYDIADEEYTQDPEEWRLRRYPTKFLRLLRLAIQREVASVPTVADMLGLSIREVADFAGGGARDDSGLPTMAGREAAEFEQTGIVA